MNEDSDLFLSYEEEFHGNDRKLSRKERKLAVKNDRSGGKKSDRDRNRTPPLPAADLPPNALRGRVLGIYSEGIEVSTEEGLFRCRLKGSLKQHKSDTKNLVAVGDFVLFTKEEGAHLIFRVEPRKSVLSRADNLLQRKEQLIAVNIDLAVITSSVVSPPFKPSLLDRYIIASYKGKMEPVIVVNKIDLPLSEEEREMLEICEESYKRLGIPFLKVSVKTLEGIAELQEKMRGKASVFSGQSGTGKSSLINILTGSTLKVGDLVAKTSKGAHTTSTSRLLPTEGGGFCVDTPGIRSFGVWDLDAKEIQNYFTEIAETALSCRFPGCSHTEEPDCAVKLAVEKGEISPFRLASYFSLLEASQKKHRTR